MRVLYVVFTSTQDFFLLSAVYTFVNLEAIVPAQKQNLEAIISSWIQITVWSNFIRHFFYVQ